MVRCFHFCGITFVQYTNLYQTHEICITNYYDILKIRQLQNSDHSFTEQLL